MKKIHRKRLATLTIALLKATGGAGGPRRLSPPKNRVMKFDMSGWARKPSDRFGLPIVAAPADVVECGTSCCFLGYAPFVMPVTREMDDWIDVGEWLLGRVVADGWLWSFLFGTSWPSVPRYAAARALFVLRNHDVDFANSKE